MIGVELVESRETMAPAAQRAGQVRAACRERGLLVGIGGFFGNVAPHPATAGDHRGAARRRRLGVFDAALRATA